MKIQKILSQHRRDFSALMVCEHCGHQETLNSGYDDDHYHKNVIPKMKCEECGEIAPIVSFIPQETKYPSDLQV